jgi:SpoVK/Ycf46/Vps4 family AAA+-type ATPase
MAAKLLESLFDYGDNHECRRTERPNSANFSQIRMFEYPGECRLGRTEAWKPWIAKIVEAGLAGDQQRLELVLLKVIRTLRKESPELSEQLAELLSQHSVNPNGLRWKDSGPPPRDGEEGMPLVRTESVEMAVQPVLPESIERRIEQFVSERQNSQSLLKEGFLPPRSVLLTGAPGTGKTMLASWLAHELQLPLLSLDLSTSISSFLGKTGLNLRRVLDHARSRKCALLLDEFDAIAKRRDDSTELGELKRIVNVLLKELEEWPIQSVLIAATNHPDLLDPAVRRRFDLVLDLQLPGPTERLTILERAAGRFSTELPRQTLEAFAHALDGASGSDVESLMQAAVRQHLGTKSPLAKSIVCELQLRWGDKLDGKAIGPLLRAMQNGSQKHFTVRELGDMFGKSASTIQHHLTKEAVDG